MYYPPLLKVFDVYEAIILGQIHYWLQNSYNLRDGHYWTYHSYSEWSKELGFSPSTIKRKILHLEDDGYLISANYNRAGFDKTKWYRINYDKLDTLSLGLSAPTDEPVSTNERGLVDQTNTRDYTETTHNSQEPSSLRSHPAEETTIKSIIDYLNKQSDHSYHVTDKTKELIETRFSEGFTEQEFMDVIKYKSGEWKDVTEMNPFLQPSTLFGDKMDKYLNQAKSNDGSAEPQVLSVEDASAKADAYTAELEKKYEQLEIGKASP